MYVCTYVYIYIYIYIYIHIYTHLYIRICGRHGLLLVLHPVSVRRFPSFRTQPLENLSHYLWKNGFLSNPAPGENLVSGNLVMETGCTKHIQILVYLIAYFMLFIVILLCSLLFYAVYFIVFFYVCIYIYIYF